MTDRLYRNRRFGLAVGVMLTSIIALFTGHLEGGQFILQSGVVLGMYGGLLDSSDGLE